MQDNSPQPEQAHPYILLPNKLAKATPQQWAQMQALAEAGVPYPEIAADFPVGVDSIRKRSTERQWVTPARLLKAAKGQLSADDPATLVANLWKERGEQSREDIYQGAHKALQRFFALAPVPQSFNEAATAAKLLKEAITPVALNENNSNLSVTILANSGFCPKPAIDV